MGRLLPAGAAVSVLGIVQALAGHEEEKLVHCVIETFTWQLRSESRRSIRQETASRRRPQQSSGSMRVSGRDGSWIQPVGRSWANCFGPVEG